MRLLANSVSVSNLNLFNHLRKKAGKCRLDGACRSILLNIAPKHDKPKKIRVLKRNWMTSPFKVGFHMAESKKPRIIVLNSSLTQRSHDGWPDNTRHDKEITFLFSFCACCRSKLCSVVTFEEISECVSYFLLWGSYREVC